MNPIRPDHLVVHDLTCWNSNKFIYRYLLVDYDQSRPPVFRKFDYQLIGHTNLKNFFREVKQNYRTQYQQVAHLYHLHQHEIDRQLADLMAHSTEKQLTQKEELKILAYRQLTNFFLTRVDPLLFNYIVSKCLARVQPGDLIDLKNQRALGYYFVYSSPDNPNRSYIRKTQGNWGRFLPVEAWPYLEKKGWNYFSHPEEELENLVVGCQIPTTAQLNQTHLQEIVGRGGLVYFPLSQQSPQASCYLINGQEYWGQVKEKIQ